MEQDRLKFKALLDEHHIWPTTYTFKFVILAEQVKELKDLLNDDRVVLKSSSRGKYFSVTLEAVMSSSLEVISIYEKVGTMDGVISL
jgi:putative lipoic acid-binding regulatory protein